MHIQSAKLEPQILFLMYFSYPEVNLKIYLIVLKWNYFKYTLNIFSLKTDIIQRSYYPDAFCNKEVFQIKFNSNINISKSQLKRYASKFVYGFVLSMK